MTVRRVVSVFLPAWRIADEPRSKRRSRSRAPGRARPAGDDHAARRAAASLRRMAVWAIRFSPVVAPDTLRHDGLLLDVTGCERLYGGEARLLRLLAERLRRHRIACRACVAGTVGCAWALARFGAEAQCVVPPGGERAALEPLPVAALRLEPGAVEALHEVNVRLVGELLALPRAELAARFDASLLRRLDQALGAVDEVIDPIRAPEPIEAEFRFDGAVTRLEGLLVAARELVAAVARSLAHAGAGAMRLDLTAERLHAAPIRKTLRLSHPSRDVRHLWSLLRPRIESIHMGFGVERLALAAPVVRRLPHESPAPWFDGADGTPTPQAIDRAAGELIDTLSHRLGEARTLRLDVVDSHLPERIAVTTSALASEALRGRGAACGAAPVAVSPHEDPAAAADHPSLLFEAPEPIDVTVAAPDGPPHHLRWRGTEHRLIAVLGPRRLAPEWWRPDPRGAATSGERDYYRVQDSEGRWFWIYRLEPGSRWFMHGRWA